MQLSNAPGKLVLPFANAGAKNAIPVASQIGIVAGAASLTDGFPPLTRTPLAAGGVPPSGLDMNGILYALSAALRWANAGGGYVYDGTFAADANITGYPKGARILRSDGAGYWLNTIDGNTVDPESVTVNAAQVAGWVPDFTNGVAAVTMTSANVTLTALQYGKPIIVISGLLTANLNLIFPNIAGQWVVINKTTGAYSVTCKTAAGTGVAVTSASAIVGDATNIYQIASGITQAASDARYLKLTGGTLTGSLTLSGNASSALQAVPKQQLDAAATPDATTSVKGKVQLATSAEALAGTDEAKAITPATLASALAAKTQTFHTASCAVGTEFAITHGMGPVAAMRSITYGIECITGELGYSAGDRVLTQAADGARQYGFNIDDTAARFLTNGSAIGIYNKATASSTNNPITTAKWRFFLTISV